MKYKATKDGEIALSQAGPVKWFARGSEVPFYKYANNHDHIALLMKEGKVTDGDLPPLEGEEEEEKAPKKRGPKPKAKAE